MFTTNGHFSSIQCPTENDCNAFNCLFGHRARHEPRELVSSNPSNQHPPKRAKLDLISDTRSLPPEGNRTAVVPGALAAENPSSLRSSEDLRKPNRATVAQSASHDHASSLASRPISPPPRKLKSRISQPNEVDVPHKQLESLNPRLLQHDPAGHRTRLLYLNKLHENLTRLNREVLNSSDSAVRGLAADDAQLITAALEEEEGIACANPSIYANVIKSRIVMYKKMSLEQWIEKQMQAQSCKPSKSIENNCSDSHIDVFSTEMTLFDEFSILRSLVAAQDKLQEYGYVSVMPTDIEIQRAQDGVKTAGGWEQCDRCGRRFQVFPDRKADGTLTGGGRCTYHWGRISRSTSNPKTEQIEKRHDCCNETVGQSPGCVSAETHVFKISEPVRLASILRFECTPSNIEIGNDSAVAFDCEMAYTVKGMELIRLTAVTWPHGDQLLDVLVRPLGTVLDFNSRWSGVWPIDFTNAVPLKPTENTVASVNALKHSMPLAESPAVARKLLFELISPATPLIGHAIENDLNAVRIIHPTIVDTALLYPHPRGLPYRRSLKVLTKQYLHRDIQLSNTIGHDSKEDARAAGDLVRLRVVQEWRTKRNAQGDSAGGRTEAD